MRAILKETMKKSTISVVSGNILKNREVKEFNDFFLAMQGRDTERRLSSLEREAIGSPEECRKVYSQVEQIFKKAVRRMSYLKLRMRIMKSNRGAKRLMYKLLMSGKQIWYNAFYHVVGRVPTGFEERALMKLRAAVLRSKVVHAPSTRVWIDKPGTQEKRPLNVPTVADRVIGKVVLEVLSTVRERHFNRRSSGFRMAWDRVKAMIGLMNTLTEESQLMSADVRKCFDRISHVELRKVIQGWGLPKGYEQWALSSLTAEIRDPGTGLVTVPVIGTPQGGVLSPLLCNETLNPLDWSITGAYDRYADNLVFESNQLEKVKGYLASKGLEVKEEMLETLKRGSSIVHLGCELLLDKVRKLTVWYKRITPKYPPKAKKTLMRIRSVLPKLAMDDSRRERANMSGFYTGNGDKIVLGAPLLSPYGRGETWISPHDVGEEGKYLAWCGISLYGSKLWYASATNWTTCNAVSGKGSLSSTDERVVEVISKKIRTKGVNKSLYKAIRGQVSTKEYIFDENTPSLVSKV